MTAKFALLSGSPLMNWQQRVVGGKAMLLNRADFERRLLLVDGVVTRFSYWVRERRIGQLVATGLLLARAEARSPSQSDPEPPNGDPQLPAEGTLNSTCSQAGHQKLVRLVGRCLAGMSHGYWKCAS